MIKNKKIGKNKELDIEQAIAIIIEKIDQIEIQTDLQRRITLNIMDDYYGVEKAREKMKEFFTDFINLLSDVDEKDKKDMIAHLEEVAKTYAV